MEALLPLVIVVPTVLALLVRVNTRVEITTDDRHNCYALLPEEGVDVLSEHLVLFQDIADFLLDLLNLRVDSLSIPYSCLQVGCLLIFQYAKKFHNVVL